MMTAEALLNQIYRELEISVAAGTHFYSGTFTVDRIAYCLNRAMLAVQPFIVASDLEPMVVRVAGQTITAGLTDRPSDFHVMLAAKIGTQPLFVQSPGSGLDRSVWLDSTSVPQNRAVISAYSKTQFIIRGSYDTGGTLDFIYQRKPIAPAVVATMDFNAASDLVVLTDAGDYGFSPYPDTYIGAQVFNITDSLRYTVLTNVDGSELGVSTNIVTNANSKAGTVFSVPEIPEEYHDAMLAKTCLLLCNGEDRGGWRERFESPTMLGTVNVDRGPRLYAQSLWDSFD